MTHSSRACNDAVRTSKRDSSSADAIYSTHHHGRGKWSKTCEQALSGSLLKLLKSNDNRADLWKGREVRGGRFGGLNPSG